MFTRKRMESYMHTHIALTLYNILNTYLGHIMDDRKAAESFKSRFMVITCNEINNIIHNIITYIILYIIKYNINL